MRPSHIIPADWPLTVRFYTIYNPKRQGEATVVRDPATGPCTNESRQTGDGRSGDPAEVTVALRGGTLREGNGKPGI